MKTATLKEPYKGYRNIILIERWGDKWEVEICGSGKHIFVYEFRYSMQTNCKAIRYTENGIQNCIRM